jgi:hypothetical protein
MLNNFNEDILSTSPPTETSTLPRGRYDSYPQSSTRGAELSRRSRLLPYEIPPAPGLIRDGEEGYTSSLPPSPLDMTFTNVHTAAQSTAISAADSMCGASFGDVTAAYPNTFDVCGMSGVGYSGSMHSPTSHFGVVSILFG